MAAHSSILAWRIPWTVEPGGLQSMGFSKQEYWSGLLLLSSRGSSCIFYMSYIAGGFFTAEPLRKPVNA